MPLPLRATPFADLQEYRQAQATRSTARTSLLDRALSLPCQRGCLSDDCRFAPRWCVCVCACARARARVNECASRMTAGALRGGVCVCVCVCVRVCARVCQRGCHSDDSHCAPRVYATHTHTHTHTSQSASASQRFVNPKVWVPAGAMYQPSATLSWNRQCAIECVLVL